MSIIQADRPRSERKARGSGHLRRAELLAAAQKIFTVSGYEGATIRKIAEEVGVSSTALYMYFQDKSQIMLEICVHALEELYHQLEAITVDDRAPAATAISTACRVRWKHERVSGAITALRRSFTSLGATQYSS